LRDLAGQIKHDDVYRAAATLFKFGDLIRNLVASHRGSEIRAQGDSYLCICPTAATAVDLALAILSATTASAEGEALAVSCGVVAKAGLRTAEGYAQAARLGGAAPVGSLLVTEEVRELTPDLRGTYRRARELEGVTKSGARLWLVTMPMAAVKLAPAAPRRHTLRFAAIGFGAVLLAILAIGCCSAAAAACRLDPGRSRHRYHFPALERTWAQRYRTQPSWRSTRRTHRVA
jgi:hypothetical protein